MRHLAILFAIALSACGTQYRDTAQPISAVNDLEVSRYLGTWYEIARFPVPFQRGCTATKATYGALDPNTISVLNQCRQDTPDGPLRQIEGTARVVAPGQLKVQFSSVPFVRADYWVLWVDQTYQTAVIGVPNGKAGWILARQPEISAQRREMAEAIFRANGYNPAVLIDVVH